MEQIRPFSPHRPNATRRTKPPGQLGPTHTGPAAQEAATPVAQTRSAWPSSGTDMNRVGQWFANVLELEISMERGRYFFLLYCLDKIFFFMDLSTGMSRQNILNIFVKNIRNISYVTTRTFAPVGAPRRPEIPSDDIVVGRASFR
jgi:hypothetical protein